MLCGEYNFSSIIDTNIDGNEVTILEVNDNKI